MKHASVALTAPAALVFACQALAAPLDPHLIPKFVDLLVIPPVMRPAVGQGQGQGTPQGGPVVKYRIAVRQFNQQVLPTPFPETAVWGYGRDGDSATFNYPAFTVETRTDQKVRVTWLNQLVDNPGSNHAQFLPHLFAVDQTLHWANPPGRPTARAVTRSRTWGPCPS